jgi:site-specific DNA recombinase
MADIEAGRVDCVVVYKVDRLSRSLLDFARMMETFEKYKVSFVSVTQQFNTASSMGRLVLNVLLSFAQFEREIISERTREKIAAARRKGKWVGGMPLLGFDVDPRGSKLIVNDDEAVRVRAIFDLYLEHQSLLAVIQVLDARGWSNKRWTTRKGVERGGKPFTKKSLHKLLTNVTYVGKLRYKDEVHDGEHAAIVDAAVWERVQSLLQRNGRSGGGRGPQQVRSLAEGAAPVRSLRLGHDPDARDQGRHQAVSVLRALPRPATGLAELPFPLDSGHRDRAVRRRPDSGHRPRPRFDPRNGRPGAATGGGRTRRP